MTRRHVGELFWALLTCLMGCAANLDNVFKDIDIIVETQHHDTPENQLAEEDAHRRIVSELAPFRINTLFALLNRLTPSKDEIQSADRLEAAVHVLAMAWGETPQEPNRRENVEQALCRWLAIQTPGPLVKIWTMFEWVGQTELYPPRQDALLTCFTRQFAAYIDDQALMASMGIIGHKPQRFRICDGVTRVIQGLGAGNFGWYIGDEFDKREAARLKCREWLVKNGYLLAPVPSQSAPHEEKPVDKPEK